ncbi:hypothetical protein [Bacillus infantis]|uniref:hypothetical protein n=1 Tax=Bacillus infantis TaxID=324767 RepID=UPI003CEDD9FB
MEARRYLEQVEKIDKLITNKMAEAEQWMAMAMSSTAPMGGERVQSSGSQQKMADAVGKYVDIQKDIDAEIDRLVDVKKEVIRTIEQLPPDEYDVLHKKYIQLKDFKEIAPEVGKAYTWVTSVHGRALKNLQSILNKR